MKINWKEVKERKENLFRLEGLLAKSERIDSNWRETESGKDLLEQYIKAVDKVCECYGFYTHQEIVAYSLAPIKSYGGSF